MTRTKPCSILESRAPVTAQLPDQDPAQKAAYVAQTRASLEKHFVLNVVGEPFIPPHVSAGIWTIRKISTFFNAVGAPVGFFRASEILSSLPKTLTILILCGWTQWDQFDIIFASDGTHNFRILDNSLPVQKSQAILAFGESFGAEFFRTQSYLLPMSIVKSTSFVSAQRRRVPLVESTKIGSGKFGDVFEESIPPHLYSSERGQVNESSYVIARKSITAQTYFGNEKKTGQIFGGSATRHRAILSFLSTFVDNDRLSIIYEKADMDLEAFLLLPDNNAKIGLSPADIFGNLSDIADALNFLHTEIHPDGSKQPYVCYHRGLTHWNILVFNAASNPIWKIADFGIVSQEPGSHRQVGFLGDIVCREYADASPLMPPRWHWAPERQYNCVGPHSNIWSLACIMMLVITRCLDGLTQLEELNEYMLTDHSFGQQSLDERMEQWLQRLAAADVSKPNASQRKQCVSLLHRMLMFDPRKRAKAAEVAQNLRDLAKALRDDVTRDGSPDGDGAAALPEHDDSKSSTSPLNNILAEASYFDLATPPVQDAITKNLDYIRQFCPPSAPDGSYSNFERANSDRDRPAPKSFESFKAFMQNDRASVLLISTPIQGRSTPLTPIAMAGLTWTREQQMICIIHHYQYITPKMGRVTGAKRLLYALISNFMHHHARTDQGAHAFVDSADLACLVPETENLERARNLLARLVESVQSPCVIFLEDFDGVVKDDMDDACDVLKFLAERAHKAPKTIKIVASTMFRFANILAHVGPLCIPI